MEGVGEKERRESSKKERVTLKKSVGLSLPTGFVLPRLGDELGELLGLLLGVLPGVPQVLLQLLAPPLRLLQLGAQLQDALLEGVDAMARLALALQLLYDARGRLDVPERDAYRVY